MRFVLPSLALLAAALACAPAAPAARASAAPGDPPRQYGRDRLADIVHARIELAVDIPSERVEGATELTLAGLGAGTSRVEVDAVRFEIARVAVDGREAEHDYDGRRLGVTMEPPLREGETRILRVEYAAEPRNGLYFVHGARRADDQCWSQGETEENRHWFPVHDDPSERLTSETIITVARPLMVVGNGTLLSVTDLPDGRRTFHHRIDFPHVPYLVSIAVGDWATTRGEWNGIELTYHAPRARATDMERTYGNTARILGFLAQEIGVDYPYPVYRQVAVSEYMYGGMENIAATTLTDLTLHDERAHQDWPSDSLVAHEIAHQWFGNMVTCKDWDDTWLNEGFATYYAALAMADLRGPDQATVEIDGMRKSAVSASSGPGRRAIVTNRWRHAADMFDGHAYAKGGMVLHALRRELGDDAYRRAVKAWLLRHAGRSAGTAEFLAVIEDVTGRDVSRFFDQWLHRPGHPELEMDWTWEEGRCAITIVQAQEEGPPFVAPLDLQVLLADGVIDHPVRVTRRDETFHVPCASRPRAVLADPQGHLLRTLEIDRPEEEAVHVLEHAPLLLARMEAARELKDSAGLPGPLDALGRVALDSGEPWALRREAASALARAGSRATPLLLRALREDADSRVRTAAAAALGEHRGDGVASALLHAMASDDSYAVRGAAARSLGRTGGPSAERALEAAVSQRSHREEVLAGALEALAELRSARLRPLATRLAAESQPYPVRQRAVAALGRVARDEPEEPVRRQVRDLLARLLDDRSFRVRMAAAEALVVAADPGPLADLRRVAASHPHELTRARMRRRVEELEKASAAQATVQDLRRALDDERREREKLEERLRALERRLPPEEDRDAGTDSAAQGAH